MNNDDDEETLMEKKLTKIQLTLDDDDRVRLIKQKLWRSFARQGSALCFILRNKLKEKFSELEDLPIIDACLDELEGKGYLSDERFCSYALW